jgi:phosphate transport system substrate-binding protein
LSATSIAYNVPGAPVHLHLSGDVLVKIYLGQVTNWNDAAIKALNKGAALPDLKITPVYRSDGSGTTYNFTDYLSTINPQWKSQVGNATQVNFPAGVGARGSAGVAGVVANTPGALCYVDVAYALTNHLKFAAMETSAGRFVYPSLRRIGEAAAAFPKVGPNNEMHIVNPPKKAKKAYPMSTFTYCIVPVTSPNAGALQQFITYATSSTGQRFAPALDFQPIPSVVVSAARRTAATIHS